MAVDQLVLSDRLDIVHGEWWIGPKAATLSSLLYVRWVMLRRWQRELLGEHLGDCRLKDRGIGQLSLATL